MEMMELLKSMIENKASDLHITTGIAPQFRIDGNLQFLQYNAPLNAETIKLLANSILTGTQIEEFEKSKELDFSYGISG